MTLKSRITLNLIIATAVILAIIMLIIYLAFSKFRKEEFHSGLEGSVSTTKRYIARLPAEKLYLVNDFLTNEGDDREDYIIDEAVEVYNEAKIIIYRSKVPIKEPIPSEYFIDLQEGKSVFYNRGKYELIASKILINNKKYYVFTQAEDVRGHKNLQFLKLLLVILYVLSIGIISIFSYVFIQKQLKPLDDFKMKIRKITVSKLTSSIEERDNEDEINVLIRAFNKLMKRLNDSFQSQKEFNASASHEMKTPLTRMAFQLENLRGLTDKKEVISYIDSIQNEVYQLSDTLNSLLLLTRLEDTSKKHLEDVRLDEVVFDAFAVTKKSFTSFEIDFHIADTNFGDLTITGIKSLLEIVFINIFKNAALYSKEPKAYVSIVESEEKIRIKVKSEGETLNDEEQDKVFNAFSRGGNSSQIAGSGLGLRISKRIMNYHSSEINYIVEDGKYNIIELIFPKAKI